MILNNQISKKGKIKMKFKKFILMSIFISTFFNFAVYAAPTQGSKTKKKKVLRFDSLAIRGDVAEPQVFYLLNREKILLGREPIQKDLIKELEKTIEGEPF